ncbi:MAG: TIGR02147 family protein [Fibrobacteres bacterium]|nr:TIGR02147 family protein [Fibrobacterota bacterium]
MSDIYRHTDYRTFLKEWFEEAKKAHGYMSYRYLGRKLGLDPGYLVKIFQGNRHFSEQQVPVFLKVLRLDPQEAAHFQEMVRSTKARSRSMESIRVESMLVPQELEAELV